MKRLIILIFTFVCVALLFAGTAFAGAAPEAASYFTHSGYNKTYTGEDGTSHTMTVKWVGETWNKLGTVIYSINYEDVYQKDGNTYIDVMSATEIYENARPTYPNSERHSVYQVKWYADGSKEVVSDYRPAELEETVTQTALPEETTAPTTPSAAPAGTTPTPPSSTPASTDKTATKPTESVTSVPESSATPGSPPDTSPVPSADTPAVTSGPTPDITAAQENVTAESANPSPSTPSPEEEQENAPQDASASRWVWLVIVLSGISACILLALYRRRKEEKDHEDHEA